MLFGKIADCLSSNGNVGAFSKRHSTRNIPSGFTLTILLAPLTCSFALGHFSFHEKKHPACGVLHN